MHKRALKSLSDSLTTLSQEKNRIPPYVMFLAAKEEIEKALTEGWNVRRIWESLTKDGRIRCGYTTFAKYIRDCIRNRKRPDNAPVPQSEEPRQKDIPPGAIATPQGKSKPGWPKPGSGQPSALKFEPGTYRGEMPVYGKKTDYK